MKKLILVLALFLIAVTTVAQDVIVKKDGSTIVAKVEEITKIEIKYKKWSNLDGPTYSVNRSEIASINYQNGEVDNFVKEKAHKEDVMAYKNRKLSLNDNVLTDAEVKNLLGERNYQSYLSAKRQLNTGSVFGGLFAISLVGDVMSIVAIANGLDVPVYTGILWVSGALTTVSLPLMCVFNGIGKGRMKTLANEYNNGDLSVQISPSLLFDNNLPSQNKTGIGFTFSMAF